MQKFKLAKLNDADGDLDKQWFVYFSFIHPETGRMYRFRKWISNRIKTRSGRRDKAHALIKEINQKLKTGWDPFSDDDRKLTNIKEAIEYGLKLKYAKCGQRGRWTYKSALKKLEEFLEKRGLDRLAVHEFNYHVARDYMDEMLINDKLKATTINNRIESAKAVFNELKKRFFSDNEDFKEISMGMSNDYKIAVEEGATMVRIGSILFGARNY